MPDSQHISHKFEKELTQLRTDILKMGETLAEHLSTVIHSIETKTALESTAINKREEQINDLEVYLDTKCVNLLALHSPTASDLRFVISAGRMVDDLESMGDEITRISFILKSLVDKMDAKQDQPLFADIRQIADSLVEMLRNTLNAYQEEDAKAAVELILQERAMNATHENSVRARVTWIMEEPRIVKIAVPCFWILRSLERIGKCIRQINNHIIYDLEGKDARHMSSQVVKEHFMQK